MTALEAWNEGCPIAAIDAARLLLLRKTCKVEVPRLQGAVLLMNWTEMVLLKLQP